MWQDFSVDGLFDLRNSCLTSLRDYRRAAWSNAVKPINTRLPFFFQKLDQIWLYRLRIKLVQSLHGGMLPVSRLQMSQYVCRNLFRVRLPLGDNSGPVRGRGSEHD